MRDALSGFPGPRIWLSLQALQRDFVVFRFSFSSDGHPYFPKPLFAEIVGLSRSFRLVLLHQLFLRVSSVEKGVFSFLLFGG